MRKAEAAGSAGRRVASLQVPVALIVPSLLVVGACIGLLLRERGVGLFRARQSDPHKFRNRERRHSHKAITDRANAPRSSDRIPPIDRHDILLATVPNPSLEFWNVPSIDGIHWSN